MASMSQTWRLALITNGATIQDAITTLDRAATKIVLVVDADERLLGTISDGDIRRGLLRGLTLSAPLDAILQRHPLVVPPEIGRDTVTHLMVANKILQIPVVDETRRIIGLHLWEGLAGVPQRPNLMVVMAGGKGTRLRPQTETCPKPMLPVAGKPMLEHILERAIGEGFSRFVLAVRYLGEVIEDYFGNGARLGAEITYLREQEPLGTAGALGLMDVCPTSPFVVTNGDVLTDIRYGALLDFHVRQAAIGTMAVRSHEWQHPYGVVQTRGVEIIGFEEKPVVRSYINAGVYALSPEALGCLSANSRCDMPTLFERLKAMSLRTVAYPMHEPWLDVGRPDDLAKANDGEFRR